MSDFAVLALDALVKSLLIIFTLLTGFAYTTLLERRFIALIQQRVGPNRAGPFGFLQPVADGVKLFFKEDIMPAAADKVFFTLAPVITAVPALIVLAPVPVGPTVRINIPALNIDHTTSLVLVSTDVDMLWVLGVTTVAVYGIVLAGWASNNKYATLGGMRSTAQMISYELALGISAFIPVFLAGSLNFSTIVEAQSDLWFAFVPVVGQVAAVIFYITVLAETNRAPFDLPEAEQELTAGYHSEYSGMKFAAFFMAEYMKMIAMSAVFATLFLGGYRLGIPFVPEGIEVPWLFTEDVGRLHTWFGGWFAPAILGGKVIGSLMVFIWIRATLPRLRYDRLMDFGWKSLLPISFAALVYTVILVALDISVFWFVDLAQWLVSLFM
ncbi:MAG: NADH-quinone oxidoreductase subunit NuoH [Chloroflexi bacterium]|nr:NADH-quinone oxidoreductase subunit NuoH [Chloroflexota bacterium]